jgi:hypothetical protein
MAYPWIKDSKDIDPTRVDFVQITSLNGLYSSSFKSSDPITEDTLNTTDTGAIYKVKLSNGMNQWSEDDDVFSIQNSFKSSTIGFPTGQIVEYQNGKPIQCPKVYGIYLRGEIGEDGSEVNITYLGQKLSNPKDGDQDECIYDPLNCRAALDKTNWVYFGAPSTMRTGTEKFLINIKVWCSATYNLNSQNNILYYILRHYRDAELISSTEIGRSGQGAPEISTNIDSINYTVFGYVPGSSDEFFSNRDYFAVFIRNSENAAAAQVTARLEVEFILAQ